MGTSHNAAGRGLSCQASAAAALCQMSPGSSPVSLIVYGAGDLAYGEPPAPVTTVAVAGLAPGAGNAVLQAVLRTASAGPWTPAASNSLEANLLLHLQAWAAGRTFIASAELCAVWQNPWQNPPLIVLT